MTQECDIMSEEKQRCFYKAPGICRKIPYKFPRDVKKKETFKIFNYQIKTCM